MPLTLSSMPLTLSSVSFSVGTGSGEGDFGRSFASLVLSEGPGFNLALPGWLPSAEISCYRYIAMTGIRFTVGHYVTLKENFHGT